MIRSIIAEDRIIAARRTERVGKLQCEPASYKRADRELRDMIGKMLNPEPWGRPSPLEITKMVSRLLQAH